jgi:NAD(P)-dependent dehydrogenase (short-subunit alcohol dehydrogenase family)
MAEPKTNPRVWFITGASTGFGRLLVEEILRRSDRVVATARDMSKIADLAKKNSNHARSFEVDATRPAQILSVAELAIAAFGHVDVPVSKAGYGVNGAARELPEYAETAGKAREYLTTQSGKQPVIRERPSKP